MEDVRIHKTTNYSNDRYMVSMTIDKNVAIERDKGNYITVDTTLFQSYILDVHKTYSKNRYTFPARMEREKEHATLAILYCCVKSMTLNHEEIINPFYIEIQNDNTEAINEFKKLYIHYLNLIRKKNNNQLDEGEEKISLNHFLTTYLNFYAKYTGENNPFEMTLSEMMSRYPTFMDHFFNHNEKEKYNSHSLAYCPTLFEALPRLSELAKHEIESIFKNHVYTKNLSSERSAVIKEVTTCYNDPYSQTYD